MNLNGQSVLSLAVRDPGSGESSTVTIPLNTNLVGLGGLLSPEALAALEQAAVTILRPVDGFVSVGDEPIEISGDVGNGESLGGLSVNGVDALSTLKPDGGFVVPIPGTTKEISVFMVDRQGVTLDTRYRTSQVEQHGLGDRRRRRADRQGPLLREAHQEDEAPARCRDGARSPEPADPRRGRAASQPAHGPDPSAEPSSRART